MSKTLCISMSVLLLVAVLLTGAAFAANKNAPILYGNMTGIATVGDPPKQLPDVLLAPAGYKNTKIVTTVADLKAEWAKRSSYSVLIFAYHTFTNATTGA
ncbi:MAG: hypothetical protein AAB116_14580, partial [Candidatus Poribacteria bacterium]